ncbi:chemotaxis protein [Thioalkalivibrio sulfidiphilus]|uniref:Response regulator receiver modulated CheW protein n=1 Tax=Thioalkalivibrio sulfidiphilus (strain HL-EbGR7) TaxID=396588 RepID=B8GQA6_THISH|nr:chemotaxis protein [Thioalkalivibrio sulfidiphilus]ACL72301.1 response regulator receiver modulated CheW protein [Thioalkalivibrio sulfidiphilus HL-EbGr7]
MTGVLDEVNRRTQLVGQNRLELLMFHLGDKQLFGINVFKVREVIPCPPLKRMPDSHPVVAGIAHIRGSTVPLIDMAKAIGKAPLPKTEGTFVIMTEFNRTVQGFLVSAVDRIVNLNWDAIRPPPKGTEKGSYLTAVTNVDNKLVEIVDVEKVLELVTGPAKGVSAEIAQAGQEASGRVRRVLVADDSSVARKQIKRSLDEIGVESIIVKDGREALDTLKELTAVTGSIDDQIALLLSDIEMPEMDGYTLTSELRKVPELAGLHVILHSSLSGSFNAAMVQRAGANRFLPKFNPDELAAAVLEHIKGSADS